MKKQLALLFLMLGMACVSCSDDETDNGTQSAANVNSVFINGVPKVAGLIRTISFDESGRVSAMDTYDGEVLFEYGDGIVRMLVYDGPDQVYETIDMTIGKNGYVSQAASTYEDPEGDGLVTSYVQFKYNSDDQLNYAKFFEKGESASPYSEVSVAYKDGNIVKVQNYHEGRYYESAILYTSSSASSPIDNKGCVMLFDQTFDIDLDEYGYAYYAGLLGKATKHLPVGISNEEGTYYHNWALNASGFPTKFVGRYNTFNFEW